MTNRNLTLIGVLVDRSGSMKSMHDEMTTAIRIFLQEQANRPGKAQVSLSQFDNYYDDVYSLVEINDVPDYILKPRGSTALLDAMGKFITDTGKELDAREEKDKPGKVLICIVTDGYENSSKEWTKAMVKNLVEQQQNDYQWEFVFLGANIDAIQVAQELGMRADSAMTFTPDRASVAMASMSNYASRYRTNGQASFSEEDRRKARNDS
jgi:uncharacterized protein YegL